MSPLRVRILLLEADPAEARNLRQMLWESEGFSPEITWLERPAFDRKQLEDSRAEVVLLALPAADLECHELLAAVRTHAQKVPIIILAAGGQELLARKAVSQGARDYLVKGRWNTHSLARTILSAIERRQAGPELGRQPGSAAKGKVLGFAGAKGGAGATTLVLNTSAVLSRNYTRVIAAELTPGCGGFALHLGKPKPRHGDLESLLHLAEGDISEQALAACLTPLPFGVQALFGPRPGAAGLLRNEQMEAVVQAAAMQADYVILDLPPFSSPLCQAAARGCDLVVLVIDREPACVAAGREGAELLRSWGCTENGVVINNRTPLAALGSADEVRAAVKCEILGVVPHDMVLASVWRREAPLVVTDPASPTSESLAEIAKRLAQMGQTADALVF